MHFYEVNYLDMPLEMPLDIPLSSLGATYYIRIRAIESITRHVIRTDPYAYSSTMY